MTTKSETAELTQALAILISSTRTKTRPMSLPQIANWIVKASSHLGSTNAVAERIGLSPKMLRQFLTVNKLRPEVRHLFAERKLDSVDAAAHLAMLPNPDQLKIAQMLSAGELDTADVRAIHQLIKAGDRHSLDGIVQRVKESKTKQQYVAEFVVRGSLNAGNVAEAFEMFIPPQEIVSLKVEGVVGRLILTRKGKAALSRAAKALNTPLQRVIPAIFREYRKSK